MDFNNSQKTIKGFLDLTQFVLNPWDCKQRRGQEEYGATCRPQSTPDSAHVDILAYLIHQCLIQVYSYVVSYEF